MPFKHILYVLIFFVVVICSAAGVATYLYNEPCRNLNRIASDRDLVSKIWGIVSFYYKDPAYLKASALKSGTFYINEMEVELGSDVEWKEIGINPTVVTLQISGKDIDYSNIEVNQVEEVRVGFGYRFRIVYRLADFNSQLSNNNPADASYVVSVECSG